MVAEDGVDGTVDMYGLARHPFESRSGRKDDFDEQRRPRYSAEVTGSQARRADRRRFQRRSKAQASTPVSASPSTGGGFESESCIAVEKYRNPGAVGRKRRAIGMTVAVITITSDYDRTALHYDQELAALLWSLGLPGPPRLDVRRARPIDRKVRSSKAKASSLAVSTQLERINQL